MSSVALPDPDQRPNADVVIFDGDCRFCRAQVDRLRRFDGGERLAYMSLHDQRVKERYPDLSHSQMMEQMWVVTPDGFKAGGADAVRYLSRRLPRLYWLAPLLHIPFLMPVWRWFYRRVAERRYRLAGADCSEGSCNLHDSNRRAK